LSDNIEWQPPSDEPDNGRRRGADAVTAYVREWAATFDDYRCEVEELIDRQRCVVAPLVLHGRIGEAGQELSIPLTQVWTISDGKVVLVREYRTKEEALEAT
jgi:ketosteroid isomerase-like protein